MRHFVVVGILILLMAVLTYVGLDSVGLMPVQASAQSVPIDRMWNEQVIAMSFLFALIVVPMIYSLVVFRRKKGDTTDAKHIEGNTNLEITWTILPLFAVVAFAYLGGNSLAQTLRADPDAMVVKVIGRQWSWSFEYPVYGVFSTELRVPVGKQIHLEMTSTDVIHSFWVPEFRVKADAVPGIVNELRVTPTNLGEYSLICSEICGRGHAYMKSVVKVVAEQDFQAWIAERQVVTDDPVARGQKWVKQFGCLGCHSYDGSENIGPTFKGLYGKQEKLEDGTTIQVDETYLIESMRYPGKEIVSDFSDIMPSDIAAGLTDEQIQDIIAYMATLK